ncbi:hypothetical protein B0H66DRAFT_227572 [Apodospora peruviana]|uniref:Tail specific protease domain-containing protein n=1 Tax=Apodospora peruviana TaxID=516989 RepID=A0AAE0I4D4_9PEZI|nr:hypothetical protein B0H66DRAFT_227572 [Apodospora peruviana]
MSTTTMRKRAMPRAITKINGEDAAVVLERRNLVFSGYQDPDSQWNAGMQSYASKGALNFVAASLDFNGPTLTLTYDTGEERTEDNFAIVRPGANFTGIATGEDFYNRFCNPESAALTAAEATSTTSEAASSATAATVTPEPTIEGYPFPVIRDNGANITHGYFLNGTGYEDVAVLAVNGFSPSGDFNGNEYLRNFQETLEKFLADCKAQNKKRLVIDVLGNGGGYVVAGYELFTQLFPDAPKFQAHNLRETESLRQMAEVAGRFLDQIVSFDASTITVNASERVQPAVRIAAAQAEDAAQAQATAFAILQQSSIVSNLVPGGVFAPDGSNLTSVDQILSPVTIKGDRFTAYQQTPLNMTSPSFNLTGTGNKANPAPAVFAPEDIVILTDGTCGSTCTLFSYLMILQLNIKTTVVGGRPQPGPMQSVAGVEGAQVFYLQELSAAATAVLLLDPASNVTDSELALLDEGYALSRAFNPDSPGAVNGKNAFSRMDSQTPLQFLYQPANCRIFWTKEMLFAPEEVWKRTVDATWADPDRFCVEGSRVNLDMSAKVTDTKFFVGGKGAPVVGESSAQRGTGGIEGFKVVSATVVALVMALLI